MVKSKYLLLILCLLIGSQIKAQTPTVGLIEDEGNVSEGYTLFTPESNNSVYLIDNCGSVVNEWVFNDQPNRSCYLLENGDLLRGGKNFLERRGWDGEIKWSYDVIDNEFGLHHDIEPLPNGNILCILYDVHPKADLIEAGRNPNITDDEFQLDKIVEIKPIGENDIEIVWSWSLIDHLVQDFDVTKNNFGVVADHPELIDINFDNEETFNFSHMNGLDYNASLDQILFSARNLNEIYIIDHSTTTEEASSHTGGNSNKGGDILWRWGNPQVYGQGSDEDRMLGGQHNPEWIASGHVNEGLISVFNNNPPNTELTSEIVIIEPEIVDGEYQIFDGKFEPESAFWSWRGVLLGEQFYEEKKSGIQIQENGNVLICESSKGRITEINRDGDVLWSYMNPSGQEIFNQFETPVGNSIFRAIRYPLDYEAFESITLTSRGIIEDVNQLSEVCIVEQSILSASDNFNFENFRIVNPIQNGKLEIFGQLDGISSIGIYSISGQMLFEGGYEFIATSGIQMTAGIYIVQIRSKNEIQSHRILVE